MLRMKTMCSRNVVLYIKLNRLTNESLGIIVMSVYDNETSVPSVTTTVTQCSNITSKGSVHPKDRHI